MRNLAVRWCAGRGAGGRKEGVAYIVWALRPRARWCRALKVLKCRSIRTLGPGRKPWNGVPYVRRPLGRGTGVPFRVGQALGIVPRPLGWRLPKRMTEAFMAQVMAIGNGNQGQSTGPNTRTKARARAN